MKNTLILNADQMTILYREAMVEDLKDSQNDLHPAEFATDLIQLGTTLKNLTSNNNDTALKSFRQEFEAGFTAQLLSVEEFDQLERWSDNKEEFRIAIFREDGTAVGIVNSNTVNW